MKRLTLLICLAVVIACQKGAPPAEQKARSDSQQVAAAPLRSADESPASQSGRQTYTFNTDSIYSYTDLQEYIQSRHIEIIKAPYSLDDTLALSEIDDSYAGMVPFNVVVGPYLSSSFSRRLNIPENLQNISVNSISQPSSENQLLWVLLKDTLGIIALHDSIYSAHLLYKDYGPLSITNDWIISLPGKDSLTPQRWKVLPNGTFGPVTVE